MYNHAPVGYNCPFCIIASGGDKSIDSKLTDVIYQDSDITAFISAFWWPNNAGHVIVIPNSHYENIYDTPSDL